MMGIFSSKSQDKEEKKGFPERIILSRIKAQTKKIKETIDSYNQNHNKDLPELGDVPHEKRLFRFDSILSDEYQSMSEKQPEDHFGRRQLIKARQETQELIDMYLTYYSVSEPVTAKRENGGDRDVAASDSQ